VTVAGTTLNALDISGFVDIQANDVTIKNSRIRNGGAAWEQVRVESGSSGALIEDTEIDGQNVQCSCSPNDGYGIGGTGGYTALRLNIHNNIDGVGMGGGFPDSLQDSWIHDLHLTSGSHNDGIICDCSPAGVIIRHNRIETQTTTAGPVFLRGDGGPVQNVTVDNNLLNGGGFTIYGGCDVRATYGSQCQNISFTNNRFMRAPEAGTFYALGGLWGPTTCFNGKGCGDVNQGGDDLAYRAAHNLTWSGNVWEDSGTLIGL